MKKILLIVLVNISLIGCASSTTKSIRAYNDAKSDIEIGQSKTEVLAIFRDARDKIKDKQARDPEIFEIDGKVREIHFLRSRRLNDGALTDDEFTPYVFEDNVLVAVGWTALGGPKTQGSNFRNHGGSVFFGSRFGFGRGFGKFGGFRGGFRGRGFRH